MSVVIYYVRFVGANVRLVTQYVTSLMIDLREYLSLAESEFLHLSSLSQ